MKLRKGIKIRLCVFFILIISGCRISGIYEAHEYNYHENLKLHQDKTFTHTIILNHEYDTLKGDWILDNDTLILDVKYPPILNYIDNRTRIEEVVDKESDSLSFVIFFNDSIAAFIAGIYKECLCEYPDLPILTNSNGVVNIGSDENINCFSVNCLGAPLYKHTIKNKEANIYKIWLYSWTTFPIWTKYNYMSIG